MRSGSLKRRISHLRVIRERFTQHGLIEEAGLCGLEIVEALLPRTASTATVVHVRDYIRSLRKAPEREFVATA